VELELQLFSRNAEMISLLIATKDAKLQTETLTKMFLMRKKSLLLATRETVLPRIVAMKLFVTKSLDACN
jgi:hypothetical protein